MRAHTITTRSSLILVLAVVIVAVWAAPASATFPGENGRIAFSGVAPGTCCSEIFSAKPNGSDVRRLTFTPGRSHSELPDWSPNGHKIAFRSYGGAVQGRSQIYVMNADGSGLTQLTRAPGDQSSASWSPDAASLAISADWGHYPARSGIWIIPASDPDGVTQEEARRVTTLPAGFAYDSEPQFSPEGSSIVFARYRDTGASAIYRVGVEGSGIERLTRWHLNAADHDWSPDGQMIAFGSGNSGRPGTRANIYVMRADGSGRTRLTDRPPVRRGAKKGAYDPVWSPSGTQVMYMRSFPRMSVLVAMSPDGSGKHIVVGGRFAERHSPFKVDWGTHP
jgi:Tol biopolymer transport system component